LPQVLGGGFLSAPTSKVGGRTLTEPLDGNAGTGNGVMHQNTTNVVIGGSGPPPQRDTLQRVFGRHMSSSEPHIGGRADGGDGSGLGQHGALVGAGAGTAVQCAEQEGAAHPAVSSIAAGGLTGASMALPHADQIQASFGRHSIAGINAHVGGPAADASAALGAQAYATGSSIAFSKAPDLHTAAHEAAHVIQQRAGVHLKGGMGERGDVHEQHADAVADKVVRGESAEALLDGYGGSGGGDAVQCSFTESRPIPGSNSGFEIDLQTRNGAIATPATQSGMDGSIRFIPGAGDRNSNVIAITQIVKLLDQRPATAGRDLAPDTLPPDRRGRGALGTPGGILTDDDPARGVEGGFFTDVHHRPNAAGPATAPGNPLSPRYNFQPAAPGTNTGVGQTQQPAQYGGGIGGRVGQTPGFKRSDLPEDIKSAAMYDFPGTAATTVDLDFEFQSVARGEDTQHNYGSVNWGFGLRAGVVVNEHLNVVAGASATFDEALERHRDWYVHEPVTIYFGFDRDNVIGAEEAKITDLAGYLARNPRVLMTLDGFADQIGNAAYNVDLSERRVRAVRNSILGHHPAITAAQVVANPVIAGGGGGHGISTAATDATSEVPAGTGDQGGNAANGADQGREANRQFNRRVTITFSHPAGTGPGAPGGVGAPPAPAGPAPVGP
jgi:outer membrane protein OmpA-like peptidoglycan-associated protein